MDIRTIDSGAIRETQRPVGLDISQGNPVQQTEQAKIAAIEAQKAKSAPEEESRPEENKEIDKVANGLNAVLEQNGNHIKFVPYNNSDRYMVQIMDNKTDEVIRTIPAKELLDLAEKIDELVGMFMDKKT